MMKKSLAVFLAVCMAACSACALHVAAEETAAGVPSGFAAQPALYVHAVSGSNDTEAWQAWQSVHDEDFNVANPGTKYFFLPSSADDAQVDVYNAYTGSVTLNGVTIAAGATATVPYDVNQSYSVTAGGSTYTLQYMRSHAEAAIYINNPDADGNGTDLASFLNASKENSAPGTGAFVTPDGSIDNTVIKKIKGRGNTSWDKPKKGYNITYDKKVSIAGMEKNKKYSILPNYQDDSLSRNRFLYDLSDAVGMPYASDSRYVDFYINGYYWGSYQMTEKVEPGSLVPEVSDDGYLDENGNLKADFPFIAEVDASAGEGDYYVTCNSGVKITIKSPELDPEDTYYGAVKIYVASKFDTLINRCRTAVRKPTTSIADLIDLDSAAKLYLINELGKNWDAGVSSTFLTYKPDENGSYKFYGSPVWDYDNSLGNATGVRWDLNSMGVSDYERYTGWWCRYKGKSSSETNSYNIINNFANNQEVQEVATEVWFKDFMPAIRHFSGAAYNEAVNRDLYPSDTYYSLVKDSADMNYASGWLLTTGGWIADHTSLTPATFDFYTGTYTVASTAAHYNQSNYTDMYNYARDWMLSRAAWLSNEMYAGYTGSTVKYDIDRDGVFGINDITLLQRYLAEFTDLDALQRDIANADGKQPLTIQDVTFLQRELAGLNAPVIPGGTVPVTFVNTLDWSGDIFVYFWDSSLATTSWPGETMTRIVDIDGKAAYTYNVPADAPNVIFDNGTQQTDNIPFDGQPHVYRALSAVNGNGRHQFTID